MTRTAEVQTNASCRREGLPAWFRQPLPDQEKIAAMRRVVGSGALYTVCQGARCPNTGVCWGRGVATFMILGHRCTRACRFCGVEHGCPDPIDPGEPDAVAEAVRRLGLRYVVMTSVTRDDLPDQGAGQFAAAIEAIRARCPNVGIEVLIPDFSGEDRLVDAVVEAWPETIGHNIEMVPRLFSTLRPEGGYDRSLGILRRVGRSSQGRVMVKSGFMVGLGETDSEVIEVLRDLHQAGCDVVTIGQYLAPSDGPRHVGVRRFVSPEQFDEYARIGRGLGIRHVVSGPLVRSSYLAHEAYVAGTTRGSEEA